MSDIKNPGYWLGHIFTVIATVVGIYFAALVGFKLAVDLPVCQPGPIHTLFGIT